MENDNVFTEDDITATTARQRRQAMKKKTATQNSVSLDENANNGQIQ